MRKREKVINLEPSSLAATLRRVPLFADLSESELALIAGQITLRQHDAGTTIFSEGEECHELLIVEQGSVKLLKTASNGRQQLLGIERAGNALSEVPVFDRGAYPATAEAITDAVLLSMKAEHFRGVCMQYPHVALKVIKVLGHRLRRMSRLVEDLSFSTVRGRLIAYLVHLAEEHGRRTPHGVELKLSENNEELAARLGTVRELVSRNLGRLHGEGLIEMHRRAVTVPDLKKLLEEGRRSS